MKAAAAGLLFVIGAVTPFAAHAQSHDMSGMPGMDMGMKKPDDGLGAATAQQRPVTPGMPQMDHESMDMPSSIETAPAQSIDGTTPAMKIGPIQGGPAPANARDPDSCVEGLEAGRMHGMDMDGDASLHVLIDRLETVHGRDGHGQALDAQGWYGTDVNRLWLKVDGERSDGKLGATRTEALWDHAISANWSAQAGVRHDFGEGPGRTWAAFGLQGLSPYWFDVQATAYVGEGGRTAFRIEVEDELRIVRRLVLQPDLKAEVFGRNDVRRGIGSGLSGIEAGLRLRYEISRRVAPYVGVVWTRKFGNTARLARHTDSAVRKSEAVAGIRVWF